MIPTSATRSKPNPSPNQSRIPTRRPTASLTLCLVLWLIAAPAWAIEGKVELQKDTVRLGDPIPLKLKFTAPPNHRLGPLHFPLSADTLAERARPQLTTKQDTLYEVTADLALFALGDMNISPTELLLFGPDGDSLTVTFPEQRITIAGTIPELADSTIPPDSIQPADFKPIIVPPMEIPAWVWLLLGLIVVGIAAWYWFNRRPTKVVSEVIVPRRPPWEIANERLNALEAAGYHKRGESKLFAIDLSEIVREYLEYRYGFVALEQTTSEIKSALEHITLTNDQRQTLIETLNGCDLAKYAKFDWPVPELEKSLTLARTFVADTVPQPKPEEAAA